MNDFLVVAKEFALEHNLKFCTGEEGLIINGVKAPFPNNYICFTTANGEPQYFSFVLLGKTKEEHKNLLTDMFNSIKHKNPVELFVKL